MTDEAREPPNRVQRRKQLTRAALIRAAQALIAEGKLNVPVLEITQTSTGIPADRTPHADG